MSNQKDVSEAEIKAAFAESKSSETEQSFMRLLNLMMAKEARLAEKEVALEAALKARNEQRRRDSENYTIAKIENQKRCKHLKGGKGRTRGQQQDYAVFLHTFVDATQVIKCQLCGARWLSKDTKDYLDRNGSKIPNWTKIGWNEAAEMLSASSNRPSSSERFTAAAQTNEEKSIKDDKGADVPNLVI
jgi:hypothetical protein